VCAFFVFVCCDDVVDVWVFSCFGDMIPFLGRFTLCFVYSVICCILLAGV
jgi:hypothetical protein